MRKVGAEAFPQRGDRESELELGSSGSTKIRTLAPPLGQLL